MQSSKRLEGICSSRNLLFKALKVALEIGLLKKVQSGMNIFYCHPDYYTDITEELAAEKLNKKETTMHIPRPRKPKPPRTDGYLSPQEFADKLCKEMKEGEFLTRKIHEKNNKDNKVKKPTHFSNITKKLSGNRGRVVVTTLFSNTVFHVAGDDSFMPAFNVWREEHKAERKRNYRKTIAGEFTPEEDSVGFNYSEQLKAFTIPQFVGVQLYRAAV